MAAAALPLFVAEDVDHYRRVTEDELILAALHALDARLLRQGKIASPLDAKAFVALRLGRLEHEVFGLVLLDAQHGIIEYREMFRGSISQTSVYPREVIKEALQLNAAATFLVHCHPSGNPLPSQADKHLTASLKTALALVDVTVLDHLIVGGGQTFSFAEAGLL